MYHCRTVSVVDGQIDSQCEKWISESVVCCRLRREQLAKIDWNMSSSKFPAYAAPDENPIDG